MAALRQVMLGQLDIHLPKKEKEIDPHQCHLQKSIPWITESSVLIDVLTTSYPKGTIPDFQCLLNLML